MGLTQPEFLSCPTQDQEVFLKIRNKAVPNPGQSSSSVTGKRLYPFDMIPKEHRKSIVESPSPEYSRATSCVNKRESRAGRPWCFRMLNLTATLNRTTYRNASATTRQLFCDHSSRRHLLLDKLSHDQKRTLLLARFASFANGASFACHISLLPIQVTSLVDLNGKSPFTFHSYACIYLVCQITRWKWKLSVLLAFTVCASI